MRFQSWVLIVKSNPDLKIPEVKITVLLWPACTVCVTLLHYHGVANYLHVLLNVFCKTSLEANLIQCRWITNIVLFFTAGEQTLIQLSELRCVGRPSNWIFSTKVKVCKRGTPFHCYAQQLHYLSRICRHNVSSMAVYPTGELSSCKTWQNSLVHFLHRSLRWIEDCMYFLYLLFIEINNFVKKSIATVGFHFLLVSYRCSF